MILEDLKCFCGSNNLHYGYYEKDASSRYMTEVHFFECSNCNLKMELENTPYTQGSMAKKDAIEKLKKKWNKVLKGVLKESTFPNLSERPYWIDVKDRLPKNDGLYIVYRKDKKQDGLEFEFFYNRLGRFMNTHNPVTHWMPIPSKPE